VINPDKVEMEESKVTAIKEWLVLKSVQEVQVFLDFINFYRRFIYAYSRVAKGLTDLLKGRDKAGKPFVWTKVTVKAFENLKTAFTITPILHHFDPALRILVETDISGFAVTGMIS
jgi:hypothetical protein